MPDDTHDETKPGDPALGVANDVAAKEPPHEQAARPASPATPEYLPARTLNEFVYCPRLFYYEWVDGLFAHSSDTIEGGYRHARVDSRESELPQPTEEGEFEARSVQLASERYGLIAKIDLVEGADGVVSPVDYKKGRPREEEDGPRAWPADRVQVGAQALILRDNGYRCDEAVLYYAATKQRVRVAIDDALVNETIAALETARATAASGKRPPPLIDSPKCPKCSLVGICLPDETLLALTLGNGEDAQLALFPDEHEREPGSLNVHASDEFPRRLVPARDDLKPLYVAGYDLIVGKTGEVLRIRQKSKTVQDVRIQDISHVNVFGNVTITAPALHGLCQAEKPIAHFSHGAWFYGLTQGLGLKNVFLRRDQFALSALPAFCASIARRIVHNKIRNQRKLLQRNHIDLPKIVLDQLNRYADAALRAPELDTLLGIEGTASRIYFGQLAGMLKSDRADPKSGDFAFDFDGRNRRPPRDPVNALLSLAYSLLAKDLTIICASIGFDPFIGFYHQPRFGRPALALDMMEAFRPLIADSAVITAINTRMITPDDFIKVGPAVALKPKGRKAFLRAYEQRMDTLVTHPQFGYRVNYRRVLEVQARLLARVVTGELSTYPGFETR